MDFTGHGILIKNSSRIRVKNFSGISGFFYAIRIENSDSVTISNCNLSDNIKDTSGFIDVWSDVSGAHGGGLLMYQSHNCVLSGNVMKNSNDGIALYHSTSSYLDDNDLSHNTGYAVRMFFSDSNAILNNHCSHVYRENPVNSDAGAILMIVSNNNRVEHNDFSYSSDGIFLGQYGFTHIPNNNYFAYNDCSYSPHNAIEATFADGNVFKHNKANFSGYGFWLGYSFNTLVDGNEIIGNHQALSVGTAGIALERGFNNRFTNNVISGNVNGIWLWEAGTAPGYESQHSHDYIIENNSLTGNTVAIEVNNTEYLTVRSNQISDNH
jgi:parallel beta-helix repeat protein